MYSILNPNNATQLDVIALHPSEMTDYSIVLYINSSCILRFNFWDDILGIHHID